MMKYQRLVCERKQVCVCVWVRFHSSQKMPEVHSFQNETYVTYKRHSVSELQPGSGGKKPISPFSSYFYTGMQLTQAQHQQKTSVVVYNLPTVQIWEFFFNRFELVMPNSRREVSGLQEEEKPKQIIYTLKPTVHLFSGPGSARKRSARLTSASPLCPSVVFLRPAKHFQPVLVFFIDTASFQHNSIQPLPDQRPNQQLSKTDLLDIGVKKP